MPSHTKHRRLSARETKQLERLMADVKTLRDTAANLDKHTLTDLIVRARYTATDPFAPAGGGGGNGVPKPTEGAAITDAGGRITRDDAGNEVCTPDTWQHPADPVRDAIADLFNRLPKVATLAATLDNRRTYVTTINDPTASRPSLAGNCACCDRVVTGAADDKLVSGYCKTCRNAWEYQGYPDRVEFQRDHQAKHRPPVAPAGEDDGSATEPEHAQRDTVTQGAS